MRVVVDARYLRGRPSGVGAYVHAVVTRAPALAPDLDWAAWMPAAGPDLAGVVRHRVEAGANSLPTLLWPSRLAALRRDDVFHATFNILGYGLPCRTVTTVHDLMWMLQPALCEGRSPATPFLAAFYSAGIAHAIRRSNRVIAISQATADDIVRVFPEAAPRVRVIRHGVEPRFRPPTSRDAVREQLAPRIGGTRYLLVVGQNAPYKNHEAILRAFAAASLPPDVRLVMLQRLYQNGRWGFSREPALARLTRHLGIGDRVTWLSGLDDGEVLALVQGATALVQFSRFEGFGMPALEALACGTPVVASDIAPLVEVLGGAGLHAALDGDQLPKQLHRIATDPGLQAELSARGVERAAAFSWERCAAEHVAVYREAGE